MVISQGDVCWVDFGPPDGSLPARPRPAVIVQSDPFNRSKIATVVCVPLTGNLERASSPGNVLLAAEATGLPRDSVANVSQITTLNKRAIGPRVGNLEKSKLGLVLAGIDIVLGR